MAIRNALPFEFPYRWNDIRRFFTALPDEAADYLDQRDRDLEDFLATLGGTDKHGFRARSDPGISTLAAGTSGYLNWEWASSSEDFHTAGVSGLDSSAPAATLAVGGLWTFSLSFYITPIVHPSISGGVNLYIEAKSGGAYSADCFVTGDDLQSGSRSKHITDRFMVADGSTVKVYYDNSLDQDVRFSSGILSGVL